MDVISNGNSAGKHVFPKLKMMVRCVWEQACSAGVHRESTGIGFMKKVGIIRCQQTEEACPGTKDFAFAAKGKGAFEVLGPCEVVGFVSCGGCPGKRAVARARMMIDRGAEAIALTTCITRGRLPCPSRDMMLKSIREEVGEHVPVLETTHQGGRSPHH